MKAKTSTHTPTPWRWGWEDASVLFIQGPREDEDHVLWAGVCDACQKTGSRCTAPTNANADWIVQCVNAHDDLLAALKDLVQINEGHNEACSIVMGKPVGWMDTYLDAARAAIAKATGDPDSS